jgi:hypothetical protein
VADERAPTREVLDLEPIVDPLIAFFWARLDEEEPPAHGDEFLPPSKAVRDLAAKRSILDDYARRCADLDNPAREMECRLIRDVIKRLCSIYDGHPGYDPAWRP